MRDELAAELLRLEPILFNSPWENRAFYADFLAQTYYYVCHSTRLLGLALSRFQVDRDGLHRRFAMHISEEKGHESLALNDLQKLGSKLDEYPQISLTRAFYESQYYKIEHQDATALFGYILLLESLAAHVGPAIHQRVLKAFGTQAASFLRVHVAEDVDHEAKALAEVELLPKNHKEYVRTNLIQTSEIYGELIAYLANKHSDNRSEHHVH